MFSFELLRLKEANSLDFHPEGLVLIAAYFSLYISSSYRVRAILFSNFPVPLALSSFSALYFSEE